MNNLISNKLAKVSVLVVFLIALAINIKVTLDDPFLILTEGVLTQISDSDESTISSSSSKQYDDEESLDVRQGYSWGQQSVPKSTIRTTVTTISSEVETKISRGLIKVFSFVEKSRLKDQNRKPLPLTI